MSLDDIDRLTLAATEAMAVLTDGGVLTTTLIGDIAYRWSVSPEEVLGRLWPSLPPGQEA